MRRYLLFFFIVFLPIQFAWSAAAPYCGHEEKPLVEHFGHHVHVHEVASSVGDADPLAGTALGNDMDCDYCHIGCAQPLSASLKNPSFESAYALSPTRLSPVHLGLPSSIERPNWMLAA